MIDQNAHVYPTIGPGMGYRDMITGKWIPARDEPREGGGSVDPDAMF